MEKRNSSDEVDLLELLLKGVNAFRANFLLIISFFLVGIGLGFISFFTERKVFENRMVVSSTILTKSYGTILIDKLNKHLSENNVQSLTEDLKISPETVAAVRHLKIEPITEADESKETDRFIIIAETYNQDKLADLQNGLVYYFENNEFAKIRENQNKEFLKQVISKLDQEIKDMEDFKLRLFKGDFLQSAKGNVMFDPTSVNSKIVDLTKEKLNFQNSFALANSVYIIEGFTPFEKPSKPKLSVSLAAGAFSGLILVAIVLGIKSLYRLMNMADSAKRTP
jgi:hypothetical protein